MKFLLLSIGTRGDAEPFLAIGDLLQEAGHEVVIALPAQFQHLAEDDGLTFEPFDARFLEILASQTARDFMGQKGSLLHRLYQLRQVSRSSLAVQKDMIGEQLAFIERHRPDRVLYHPKCLLARPWGMANPGRAICISPVPNVLHPTDAYPHIAINAQLGKWGNLRSYDLINFATATMTARYAKPHRAAFPDIEIGRSAILRYMREQERVLYLISPTLFPRPESWPEQAKLMGYFERPKLNQWTPSDELLKFLDDYEHITLITFGSMVNADPEATTATIVKVLERHAIPAIINTSSGGLLTCADTSSHIHFTNNIPYDWIFPRVHSVIHHGGSGTTHTAVKHGRPNCIIPHIIDQFFWNRRIAELGLGPLGPKIKDLNSNNFENLLLKLRSTPSFVFRALECAESMEREANQQRLIWELIR